MLKIGGSILERPVRFRNRAVRFWNAPFDFETGRFDFGNALTFPQCPAKRIMTQMRLQRVYVQN